MIGNEGQKTDQQEILVVDDTPASLQLLKMGSGHDNSMKTQRFICKNSAFYCL